MIKKPCELCSTEFSTKDKRQRFCSSTCSAKKNNTGVNRWANKFNECKNCGVDISARKDKRDKYCSKQCSIEYSYKQSKYYGVPLPKCKMCENNVTKHGNKYCSVKCSGKAIADTKYGVGYTPILSPKPCINCGKDFKPSSSKVACCSLQCNIDKRNKEKIAAWLEDPSTGTVKGRGLSRAIRKYLIEQAGNKCGEPDCGWSRINPSTGLVPLEIEHIDGDSMNNHPSNLKVMCPNCHSLTSTYRALNKGKSTRKR